MDQKLEALVRALTGFGSQQMEDVGVLGFVFVMLVSLACSIFIAYLYGYFYSQHSTGSQIHRSFPLLGISVTSIFITIQFSLPLSLGLLGALSIVRFRTPIKEPEEIGFLMLVIAAAISCATFNFLFLGIVLAVAVVALLLMNSGLLNRRQSEGMIVITLSEAAQGSGYGELLAHLNDNTSQGRLESIAKNGDQAVISYAFRGLQAGTLADFQSGLNRLLGHSNYDLFLNQQRVA